MTAARGLKRAGIALAGLVLLLVLGVTALMFMDFDRFKPRIEAAISHAIGMEFRIGGHLGMGLFPGPHATFGDVKLIDAHGFTLVSAKRVRLRVAWRPLLHREFRLRRLEVSQPTLSLRRGSPGGLDIEVAQHVLGLLAPLEDGVASFTRGAIRRSGEGPGGEWEASGIGLTVDHIRLDRGTKAGSTPDLRFQATLTCDSILTKNGALTGVRASVHEANQLLEFSPLSLSVYGGKLSGVGLADLSGLAPRYGARCVLQQFRIEAFLATISPARAAEGRMDLSANLSMQGSNAHELLQTIAGDVTLRGTGLELVDNDLDAKLARFESSQNFNLVDVGALFFAGPLGLAVTRSSSFASLFLGTGGSTSIRELVSDWRVEHGVAHARDVAFVTPRNRIALQGGLDFANARYDELTLAVVDAKGCARVRQVMRGDFASPKVEKPHLLSSLAGPAVRLLKQTRHLLPRGPCKPFYTGSVAATK